MPHNNTSLLRIAVVEAKGVGTNIDAEDLTRQIKAHSLSKFSRPSMMQAVDAGKRTEIDALNATFVREGLALGIPMPYNESVVAFTKGVERTGVENRSFEPSLYKNDPFTKTGSGHTERKLQKRDAFFAAMTRKTLPESSQQSFYDAWEEREAAEGNAGNSPMLSDTSRRASNDYSIRPKL